MAERRISEDQCRMAMAECERHFRRLKAEGCADDVAADRTFDAWESALTGDHHCFDPRDRLFESKVRTILGGKEQ